MRVASKTATGSELLISAKGGTIYRSRRLNKVADEDEALKHAIKRLAPWFLLGPITGPLAEGIFRNLRAREYLLASLYCTALGVAWFDLIAITPLVTVRMVHLIG